MAHYDLIVAGTGFASSFFLKTYLERAGAGARVLVLERGRHDTHAWQVAQRRNSSTPAEGTFVNETPDKAWVFNIGFGGGSSCWTGGTSRFMPNDFRMRSVYGVGSDWPISYSDLEPYYQAAEEVMAVSGSDASHGLFPRSAPFPQPPHRLSRPDLAIQESFPDTFFPQATARPRLPTERRPACCGNGVCLLCPIDAKFTIANELGGLYADPRVDLRLETRVLSVETKAGLAAGVTFASAGGATEATGDLVVLGANGLFNPHLLLRSGFRHPLLGRFLHEQAAVDIRVDLDGMESVGGSTLITGQGFMFYDGPHRKTRAAAVVTTQNPATVRVERGRWRQRMHLTVSVEALGIEANRVSFDPSRPELPIVSHAAPSIYAQQTLDRAGEMAASFLAGLPVERISIPAPTSNEAHIIGTAVMGNDPATSVVDRHLRYHGVPNLVVLGSSAFPTSTPSPPTLTIAALALWSANGVLS